MKKQMVKKLRVSKETLLPLESPQLREVVAGVVEEAAPTDTFVHIDSPRAKSYWLPEPT